MLEEEPARTTRVASRRFLYFPLYDARSNRGHVVWRMSPLRWPLRGDGDIENSKRFLGERIFKARFRCAACVISHLLARDYIRAERAWSGSSSLRRYGLDSNGIEGLRDVADALAAVLYPCETGSRQARKGFVRSCVRSLCTQLRVHFCRDADCERAASGENDAESNDRYHRHHVSSK